MKFDFAQASSFISNTLRSLARKQSKADLTHSFPIPYESMSPNFIFLNH